VCEGADTEPSYDRVTYTALYRSDRLGPCDNIPPVMPRSKSKSSKGTPGRVFAFFVAATALSWTGLEDQRMEYRCFMLANSAAQFMKLALRVAASRPGRRRRPTLSFVAIRSISANRTRLSFSRRVTCSSSCGTRAACWRSASRSAALMVTICTSDTISTSCS